MLSLTRLLTTINCHHLFLAQHINYKFRHLMRSAKECCLKQTVYCLQIYQIHQQPFNLFPMIHQQLSILVGVLLYKLMEIQSGDIAFILTMETEDLSIKFLMELVILVFTSMKLALMKLSNVVFCITLELLQ